MNKNWQWNTNPFFEQGNNGIRTYYDAPQPSKEYIINGNINQTVNIESLTDTEAVVTPGQYSVNADTRILYPSQHIAIIPTTGNEVVPLYADLRYIPILSTYKHYNRSIVYANKWNYWPGSVTGMDHKWTIDSIHNTLIRTLHPNTYTNLVITKESNVSGDYDIYLLPEFPAVNVTVGQFVLTPEEGQHNQYFLDQTKGCISIDRRYSASTISVSYTSCPLFTYVPKQAILTNTSLPVSHLTDDGIIYLTTSVVPWT